MSSFLIYGANGYTGRLAAAHAVARGMHPVLAGRNAGEVAALAQELALEWRAFPLEDAHAVEDGIRDIGAVLHCAGPFSATSRPMADACLHGGVHYLDITGEVDVFEALAVRDAEARAAGVVLLPGAGFDVVPSDCLAAHVKRRQPDAVRLCIGIGSVGGISRGTARTVIEGMGRGTQVRRGGRIVELARAPRAHIDFGTGPRPVIGASWGDVATAWHSTSIPDIGVFFRTSRAASLALATAPLLRPLLATQPMQRFLKARVARRPPGPTDEQRARGGTVIVAEAWNAAGARVASRLQAAEAYTLTAWTAVESARRVLAGGVEAGFRTPSMAFGADYIMEFDGSVRTDVA